MEDFANANIAGGMLTNLINTPPPTEALIHVYRQVVSLNANAVQLLGLKRGDQLTFKKGDAGGGVGVWVGKVSVAGYRVSMRNRCARVNSKSLCSALAESLQGQGTYRIEGENAIRDVMSGQKYYSIFFRRYD